MNLSTLKPASGATKARRRLGRGVGSGKGGHSSTRGNKGQKSRTGNNRMPAWFEGGQMPLQRRVPKFGFKNPFRITYRTFNLSQLASLIEAGRLKADVPITPGVLISAGQAGPKDRIKILGSGQVSVVLDITAHACSKSARAKIEAAGGHITILSAK